MATTAGAQESRRVALVIGNGSYRYVAPLPNARSDARLIADTLRGDGFTLVGGGPQFDLDKTAFDRVVQQFGQQIEGAGAAVFYYAGHGLQIDGTNYLVPVGANPTRQSDADFQLINANSVMHQMRDAETKLNVILLDACRNNPFGGRGLRAVGGGLTQMQAPAGTIISYATQPGNVAQDGLNGHGPYALALANALQQPGLDIFQVFNQAGLIVAEQTAGDQQPWVSNSPIKGQFFFVPPGSRVTIETPANSAASSTDPEVVFWQSTMAMGTPDAYRAYLQRYPNGRFVELAKSRVIVVPPAPASPSATSGIAQVLESDLRLHSWCFLSAGSDNRIVRDTFSARGGLSEDMYDGQGHWVTSRTGNYSLATENGKSVLSKTDSRHGGQQSYVTFSVEKLGSGQLKLTVLQARGALSGTSLRAVQCDLVNGNSLSLDISALQNPVY